MKTAIRPVADEAVAIDFLKGRRFALIGASDNRKSFSVIINTELTDRGYEIVPVNPASRCVWGRRCYATVGEVPGHIDGVLVMVPADAAADVVRQCIDANVRNIWLFRGIGGPGSTSAAATALCLDAGVNLVDGACPLMFVERAGWTHRLHHAIRVARGAVVDSRDLSSPTHEEMVSSSRR
jgi:predicted CoA-binding protein